MEIIVAEVGAAAADDQIYRLTFDGSIADERRFAVMGGSADQVADYISRALPRGHLAVRRAAAGGGRARARRYRSPRRLEPDQIEVAVLDRTRTQQRKFKRISNQTLARILSESSPDTAPTPAKAAPAGDGSEPGPTPREDPPAESGTERTDTTEAVPPKDTSTDTTTHRWHRRRSPGPTTVSRRSPDKRARAPIWTVTRSPAVLL